jgi:hypothetical protein
VLEVRVSRWFSYVLQRVCVMSLLALTIMVRIRVSH